MREDEVEIEAPVMQNKKQEDDQGKEDANDNIDDNNSKKCSMIISRHNTTVSTSLQYRRDLRGEKDPPSGRGTPCRVTTCQRTYGMPAARRSGASDGTSYGNTGTSHVSLSLASL